MIARTAKTQQSGFLLMEMIVAIIVFTVLSFTVTFWLCAIHEHRVSAQHANKALQKGRAVIDKLLHGMENSDGHDNADVAIVQGHDCIPIVTSAMPLIIKPAHTITVVAQGPGSKKIALTTVVPA
jgi:Tfp pilus assembly protein PilE